MSKHDTDSNIECGPDVLRIHWYYFPLGTKTIPYSSIRGVRRVEMNAIRGRGRIWGTANPRYWANLDVSRPTKKIGLIIDLGGLVKPFITPNDPDAVEALIRKRANLKPDASPPLGPII